jgi:hypothetical protein
VFFAPAGIFARGTALGQFTSRPFGAVVHAAGCGELPLGSTFAPRDARGEPLGAALGALVALPDGVGPGGAAVAAVLPAIRAATAIALIVVIVRMSRRGCAEVMTSSKAERRRFDAARLTSMS